MRSFFSFQFLSKHMLCVLVKIALLRRFLRAPSTYLLRRNVMKQYLIIYSDLDHGLDHGFITSNGVTRKRSWDKSSNSVPEAGIWLREHTPFLHWPGGGRQHVLRTVSPPGQKQKTCPYSSIKYLLSFCIYTSTYVLQSFEGFFYLHIMANY